MGGSVDIVDPERSCWGPTTMKSPQELKLIKIIDLLARMMVEAKDEPLNTPSAVRCRERGVEYRALVKARKAERAKRQRRPA